MALLEPYSFQPEVDDTGDVSSSDEEDSSSSEHGSLTKAGNFAEHLTGVHGHCVTLCQRQGTVSVVRKWTNLAGFTVNFHALPSMKSSPSASIQVFFELLLLPWLMCGRIQ